MSLVPGGNYQHTKLHHLAQATGDGTILEIVRESEGATSVAGFQVDGITNATVTFKVLIDTDLVDEPTAWFGILAENVTTGAESINATADGIYRVTVLGAAVLLKAEITAYVSGIITVTALVCP